MNIYSESIFNFSVKVIYLNEISVLHLPTLVGGNASFLSLGEKSNGIDSFVITIFDVNKLNLPIYDLSLHHKSKLFFTINILIFYILKIRKFDIIHYNFGMTLTATDSSLLFRFRMNIELLILKLLRKKIVVTFQGSDARQANYCKENYEFTYFNHSYFQDRNSKKEDNNKRKKIAIFDKYADLMYTTNPDLKNVLPNRTIFRPYTKLNFRLIKPVYMEYKTVRPFVIIHAPSRRHIKGTDIVEAAIKKLKNEGFLIDFLLIENMDNASAIDTYKKADLVIDQLYVGWYGGVAVEAMALGKPVMCYIRETDLKHIPKLMRNEMPIINTNPNTFYYDLKYTLENKINLKNLAHKSRKYIEKWHDNDRIAENIIKDYKTVLKG